LNTHLLNPAGRLFEFLSHTWESPDGAPIAEAWGVYLGVNSESNPAVFYTGMTQLLRLPNEVEEQVDGLVRPPIPASKLVRGLPYARSVLSLLPNMASQPVATAKRFFDKGVLVDLETCSGILNHAKDLDDEAVESGDESSIGAIGRLAREIEEEAARGDLNPEVARLIRVHAKAIALAVELYRVGGPEGVSSEFDRFVGALVLNPSAGSAVKNSQTLWPKFDELQRKVVLLGSFVAVPGLLVLEATKAYNAIEPFLRSVVTGA
jgi:hypothetical protein